MKLLLDTNVLIDLVASRSPFDEDARKLVVASVFGDVQLWVSTQSYADAYYVLRKSASEKAVKSALLATLEHFIPCGTYATDLAAALQSDWPDVEDYLVAHSAKHVQADYFITRDSRLAPLSPVSTMSAKDFLAFLEEEHGLVYEDVG